MTAPIEVSKHLAMIQRRRDHLAERLERWDPRRNSTPTRRELAAMEWALRRLTPRGKEEDVA